MSLSAARARSLSLLCALSHSLPPLVITLSFTCILYRGNAPPAQFLSIPLSLSLSPPLSRALSLSELETRGRLAHQELSSLAARYPGSPHIIKSYK
jgi:hypothetical protein